MGGRKRAKSKGLCALAHAARASPHPAGKICRFAEARCELVHTPPPLQDARVHDAGCVGWAKRSVPTISMRTISGTFAWATAKPTLPTLRKLWRYSRYSAAATSRVRRLLLLIEQLRYYFENMKGEAAAPREDPARNLDIVK